MEGVFAMIFLYGKGAIGGLYYLLDTTLFAWFSVACTSTLWQICLVGKK